MGQMYAWFVLAVLTSIYMQQQWSRYSLNYLYNVSGDDDIVSIKKADSISYADYGILTGYGFSATFCLAGLFAGRLADVSSRKLSIFFGVAVWNCALFMVGYSHSFPQVLTWRLLLGFGQAFSNPASYSLIADYFPEEQRAQANGLFACGVYIGGGIASMCIQMAGSIGWRDSCFLIAVVGFALAAIHLTLVREPPRVGAAKKLDAPAAAPELVAEGPKKSFQEALQQIFGTRLVVLVFVASSVRFMGGYIIGSYLPTFYGVVFESYNDEYSVVNTFVVAIGGFLSSWLGGTLADKWRRVEPRARMLLPACGCFCSLPFLFITMLAPNFYVSICLGLFGEYLIAECWFGPVVATMQSALDADCRALAIACFTLIATFFGSAAAYVVGELYDMLMSAGYPASVIKWLVLWGVVISYTVSGSIFLYCSTLDQTAKPTKADENKPLISDESKQEA